MLFLDANLGFHYARANTVYADRCHVYGQASRESINCARHSATEGISRTWPQKDQPLIALNNEVSKSSEMVYL